MTTVEVDAVVPESRQVTVTLPPDVPTGPVRLTVTVGGEPPPPDGYVRPADPAEAAEFDGFLRLLPGLRATHGCHYVAVRDGRVIASGMYLDPVLRLAKSAVGGAAFYCGWVEPVGGYVF